MMLRSLSFARVIGALALFAPAALRAQTTHRINSLGVFLGGGAWLPARHAPAGLRNDGGRVLAGAQFERTIGSPGWSWAASLAVAAIPGACGGSCATSGTLADVVLTRRLTVPETPAFVFAGASMGVARFARTYVAPVARGGLGVRIGSSMSTVRVEARYQYLAGAEEPHARAGALGVQVAW